VNNSELRAAAEMLRAVLTKIASGELTGSKPLVARLEGAASALQALATRSRR